MCSAPSRPGGIGWFRGFERYSMYVIKAALPRMQEDATPRRSKKQLGLPSFARRTTCAALYSGYRWRMLLAAPVRNLVDKLDGNPSRTRAPSRRRDPGLILQGLLRISTFHLLHVPSGNGVSVSRGTIRAAKSFTCKAFLTRVRSYYFTLPGFGRRAPRAVLE